MKNNKIMYDANIHIGCSTGENYFFVISKECPHDHVALFREFVESEFTKECKRLFGRNSVSIAADVIFSRNGEWLDSDEFNAIYNGEKIVIEI